MMTTMVEKVARAIYDELVRQDDGAWISPFPDDTITIDGDFDLLAVARVAIGALLEPTASMESVCEENFGVENYKAMLRAALSGSEGAGE